jgi:ABC-type sugar transport system ATPase subunit
MIHIDRLCVRAGGFYLENVSLLLPQGEYGVLMGKTGSGKTTLLEAICGLKRILSGSIHLLGRDVTALKPAERDVGYVPQDRALFPTMTVRQHLAFALELRRRGRAESARRVAEVANLLGIAPLLDRKPHGLSGGEAQRVALGRALSFAPQVLLLDEPLSALDQETRNETGQLLKQIQAATNATILHVTHSRTEARVLADRVFQLRDGQLHTLAPQELEETATTAAEHLLLAETDGCSTPTNRPPRNSK